MQRIRAYLKLPDLNDPAEEYTAGILRAFLFTLIAGSLLFIPFTILLANELINRVVYPAIFFLFLCIGLFASLRNGYVRFTGIILVLVFWGTFNVLAVTGNGVRAPAFIGGSLVAIFMAGLLVNHKFGDAITVLSILSGLGMTWAEINGVLIPDPSTLSPFGALIIGGTFFWAMAFMQSTTTKVIQRALARAQNELSERREAQTAQQETLNLLNLVINSSPDLIVVKDMDLRILTCNYTTATLLGKKPEELIGHTDLENGWPVELVEGNPESEIRGFRYTDLEALNGKTLTIPNETITINGTKRILETQKMPLYDGTGKQIGMLSIAHNITERVTAQVNVQKMLNGLRGVIEAADELIQLENLDTIYRRAVELAREKLGFERVGLFLFESDHETQRGTFGTDNHGNTTDERSRKGPTNLPQWVFEAKDKPWFLFDRPHLYIEKGQRIQMGEGWIVSTILRTAREPIGVMYNDTAISGNPVDEAQQESMAVYCSLVANIIERRRAEVREQSLLMDLRGVIEATNELIQIENTKYFYRRAVELARQKLGIERCSLHLLDEPNTNLIGTFGTDQNGNTVDESRKTEPVDINSDLLQTTDQPWGIRDGEHVYWDGSGRHLIGTGWIGLTPIMSTSGPIGVMYNDTAISQSPMDETRQESLAVYCSLLGSIIERKRIIEELRRHRENLEEQVARRTEALENSNKELESFTYTVSHGLRHPLRSIDGYSRLLMHEYSDNLDENAIGYLRNVRQGAQQMGKLIDDFLAFTRIGRQSFNKQPHSGKDMQEIVEAIVNDFTTHLGDQKTEVKIGHFHPCKADLQFLRQIFTHLISNAFKYSREREISQIEIGSAATEHGLAYFVRDNGIGIEMRYADKLFDPLFRLHKPEEFEGTGVGLAIVRRLVERHGGRVWVQSEPDKGSTFFFTLDPPPH